MDRKDCTIIKLPPRWCGDFETDTDRPSNNLAALFPSSPNVPIDMGGLVSLDYLERYHCAARFFLRPSLHFGCFLTGALVMQRRTKSSDWHTDGLAEH
jgi:hypothetical protein